MDFFWCNSLQWIRASLFTRFIDHTRRHTTVGRTPLDKWSARRRDLYLTTHNTHNRQTSLPPVRFEPTISAGERPQTYALVCAATGISVMWINPLKYKAYNYMCRTQYFFVLPEWAGSISGRVSVMKNICQFCAGIWADVCLWTIWNT